MHKEATALATIDRQNHLSLFSDIISVIATVTDAEARQKMVKMLEEQWIIGLKEKRTSKDKAEDQMLIDFAKQYVVLEQHGRELRGTWKDPRRK